MNHYYSSGNVSLYLPSAHSVNVSAFFIAFNNEVINMVLHLAKSTALLPPRPPSILRFISLPAFCGILKNPNYVQINCIIFFVLNVLCK